MGRDSNHTDTEAEIRRLQVSAWRAMTPAERAVLADKLSADVTALAVAGIRHSEPDISDDDLRVRLAERRYGREFVERYWPPKKHG